MMTEFPSSDWRDYELLDSGAGEKLERFGPYVLRRPEPKALWKPSLSEARWQELTHRIFRPGAGFGKAGKEDSGKWEEVRRMQDQWVIRYPGGKGFSFSLRLGLTAFKHVGVFPEQAPNWEWIYNKVKSMNGTPKVLNLFAYTGAASLAARAAGADVTHLDSVRQVVNWAHRNMELSGMDGIHWLVEDAMKFAKREARRGHLYDGIILDPPAYGHGPDGEKWKLDECLFEMLGTVNQILAPKNSFVVLNLYSNGYSAALGETLAKQAFGSLKHIESGELALNDSFGKVLPLSIVVRLER